MGQDFWLKAKHHLWLIYTEETYKGFWAVHRILVESETQVEARQPDPRIMLQPPLGVMSGCLRASSLAGQQVCTANASSCHWLPGPGGPGGEFLGPISAPQLWERL